MFNQEIAGYGFTHHSQADTLDRAIAENLEQGASVMAILATRIAKATRYVTSWQIIVQRNAEAVERPGDKDVLADCEDRVHHLFGIVALGQRLQV